MGPDLEPLPVDSDETAPRPVRRRARSWVSVVFASLLVVVSVVAVDGELRLRRTRDELAAAQAATVDDNDGTPVAARPLDVCTSTMTPKYVPPGWSPEFRSGDGGEGGDPAAVGHWSGGRGRFVNVLRPDNGTLPVPAAPPAEAERVTVLGAPALLGRVHEGYGVSVQVPGIVPCGFALVGYGISPDELRAVAESLGVPGTARTAPSQTPTDAARDGVDPGLAAAPLDIRSVWSVVVESEQGRWVLSRPGPEAQAALVEYGEVLLLDERGGIVRAYPMPGVPPKWIHVTQDAVYAGAIGDGGLPTSSVVQIARQTLQAEVIVIGDPTGELPPHWRQATATEAKAYRGLISFGAAAPPFTAVTSAIGPLAVDLDGVERLFRP